MNVLFCSEPFEPAAVDSVYASEFDAAIAAGMPVGLIDVDALTRKGDAARAIRRLPGDLRGLTVYRGWMLTPDQYGRLHAALAARGITLVNSPSQYRHAHWLPESYPLIEAWTARSVWVPAAELSMDRVVAMAASFGTAPILVKDYVKSRKHEWIDACFISDASSEADVRRVVGNFIERQSPDLQGGVVLRAFLPLRRIGDHPVSGLPLSAEFRRFVLDGRPIATVPYWEMVEYPVDAPPESFFAPIDSAIQSGFFTVDAALLDDGSWRVVEVGDGQVSEFPARTDLPTVYRAIAAR